MSNNNSEPENDKCKAKKKSKGKKKAKVDNKEKRLKDEKAEKTKSKKFHRRLVSLFCCCFNNQERNDQNANRTDVHSEDTSFKLLLQLLIGTVERFCAIIVLWTDDTIYYCHVVYVVFIESYLVNKYFLVLEQLHYFHSRLHKIFYFLSPQGHRKYFLQANDNPLPLWECCVIFKKITTKQDSVYSTSNSFVSFSSFLFFLSVSNLFQANFIYFFL